MNWLAMSYISVIVAAVSLLFGIISKLMAAPILWNGPKSYLGFTGLCLIFAIYCCCVQLIKRRGKEA